MKIHRSLFPLLIILVSISCTPKKAEQVSKAYLTGFVGEVNITRSGTSQNDIAIKKELMAGDIITTGSKSFALIQLGENVVVKINQNSVLNLTSLDFNSGSEISLQKGAIASKVNVLKKGEGYKISTPTAVAAVRGTEFLVSYDGNKSQVSVKRGEVAVNRPNETAVTPVTVDQTMVVDEKISVKPIDKADEKDLIEVDSLQIINDIEKTDVESIKKSHTIPAETVITQPVDENAVPNTIEEIKAKYGRIDSITLYNGKVIKGYIKKRGEVFTVIVPGGTEEIAQKQIKKSTIIQ